MMLAGSPIGSNMDGVGGAMGAAAAEQVAAINQPKLPPCIIKRLPS
jgi:hypothetical protein